MAARCGIPCCRLERRDGTSSNPCTTCGPRGKDVAGGGATGQRRRGVRQSRRPPLKVPVRLSDTRTRCASLDGGARLVRLDEAREGGNMATSGALPPAAEDSSLTRARIGALTLAYSLTALTITVARAPNPLSTQDGQLCVATTCITSAGRVTTYRPQPDWTSAPPGAGR